MPNAPEIQIPPAARTATPIRGSKSVPSMPQEPQDVLSRAARRRSMALRDEADVALLEGDVPTADEGW